MHPTQRALEQIEIAIRELEKAKSFIEILRGGTYADVPLPKHGPLSHEEVIQTLERVSRFKPRGIPMETLVTEINVNRPIDKIREEFVYTALRELEEEQKIRVISLPGGELKYVRVG